MGAETEVLSPGLMAALEELSDRRVAVRLREVFFAAASAIEQLGNINLVKYEPATSEAGAADLSLFEQMAPVVRDTVVEVNGLLDEIQKQFGAGVTANQPSSIDARLELEISSVLGRTAATLTNEINGVGAKLRKPSVVSDRWNLLIELQEIRAGFRRQIGDLVYLTAAACAANVERHLVVPGHEREVQRAMMLRNTSVDLRRTIETRLAKLAPAGPSVKKAVQSISDDLAAFATMAAYRHVHALRKRELVEVREGLAQAMESVVVTREDLVALTKPALLLIDALIAHTRDLLVENDRAIWMRCGVKIEQALLHLALGSTGAARLLTNAIAAGEAIYGRDKALDSFLRKARKQNMSLLEKEQLHAELEQFRELLANLPFH